MAFFIVSRLLLLTLLLKGTEGREWTPESDDSVHFGEFCLRISDDSHWTTSKPDPQPTPTSAQPNRPTEKAPKKPQKRIIKPVPLPEPSSIPDDLPEVVTHDYTDIVRVPANLLHEQPLSGCRCNEEKMKQPGETSRVVSLMKWYPSETCSSAEYIETLADGREVCVAPFNLFTYFHSLLSSLSKPDTLAIPNQGYSDDYNDYDDKVRNPPKATEIEGKTVLYPSPPKEHASVNQLKAQSNHQSINPPACWACTSLITNLDQKVVQSLDVEMQPLPCPLYISIKLKDNLSLCFELLEFERGLHSLGIPLSLEDNSESTPTNIVDGCRCKEKAMKLPTESSPIKNARIWLSDERCSSTEFIETLMDGREVCVTASSISTYLQTLPQKQFLEPLDRGQGMPISVQGGENFLKKVTETLHEQPYVCLGCISTKKWTSIEQKDIQSLEFPEPSPGCPIIIRLRLTDETEFCADSSNSWFWDLMHKLDMQTPEKASNMILEGAEMYDPPSS
ncbi:uncharacterized protein LOC103360121 [Stegastes partitus]|uniref:Uncharacterized protein LOC103360121 n=1 Tax=Stegastes partitus TaxID=144197 RepID=A0A9Y4JWX7_9TELE|nr:PREDICTED: uncharacterized protein LOC103360121 [Stegastes partitus]